MLQLQGIPATRFEERPAFLDASMGMIVLAGEAGPAAAGDFGEADAGALADWVRRGGRVIVLGGAGAVNAARKRFASAGSDAARRRKRGAVH